MDDTDESWTSAVDIVVVQGTPPRILGTPSSQGWRLPSIAFPHDLEDFSAIAPAAGQKLGLDLRILKRLWERRDENSRVIHLGYLMDGLGTTESALPPRSWFGGDALDRLEVEFDAQRAIVAQCLGETISNGIPPRRPTWARPGWHARAERWIEARLREHGYRQNGAIEDIRNWSISCIKRVATDRGQLYFKASGGSSLFGNEAAVTQGLARLFPGRVPAPVCIDAQQNWMLLGDFGEAVGWKVPIGTRAAVLNRFGRLQRDSVGAEKDLLALGCLDRRLDRLAAQIDPLIADEQALANVPAEDRAKLEAAVPRLKEMCVALERYRVPYTLVHGDLHLNNTAWAGTERDDFVFFDWTDACLAHPFLDVIVVQLTDDPVARPQLRDAYLENWTTYESMSRLQEMWDLALPLCALHQAVSYQHIMAGAEPASSGAPGDDSIARWIGALLGTLPPISGTPP